MEGGSIGVGDSLFSRLSKRPRRLSSAFRRVSSLVTVLVNVAIAVVRSVVWVEGIVLIEKLSSDGAVFLGHAKMKLLG